MPHASGAELYERFIGWMREVPDSTVAETLNSPIDPRRSCEKIELEHPEWHITYSAPGGNRWTQVGFHATRKAAWRPEPALFGTDINEIEAAIQAWQPPSSYGIRMVPVGETDAAQPQDVPTLIGSPEISERIGLSQEYVESIARSASFPRPAATLAQVCLWLTSDVEDWIRTYWPALGS